LVLLALSTMSACSKRPRDATPEGTVETFLRELDEAPRDPSAAARAYALLDPATRESLRVRAERARALTGQRATPETMLAPMWSPARFEIERCQSKSGGDDAHALVDVYGVDPTSQHVRVPVMREGDGWRVVLSIPPSPPMEPPTP